MAQEDLPISGGRHCKSFSPAPRYWRLVRNLKTTTTKVQRITKRTWRWSSKTRRKYFSNASFYYCFSHKLRHIRIFITLQDFRIFIILHDFCTFRHFVWFFSMFRHFAWFLHVSSFRMISACFVIWCSDVKWFLCVKTEVQYSLDDLSPVGQWKKAIWRVHTKTFGFYVWIEGLEIADELWREHSISQYYFFHFFLNR